MKQSASNQPSAFWGSIAPGVLGLPFIVGAVLFARNGHWVALPMGVLGLALLSNYIFFVPYRVAVQFDDDFLYLSKGSNEVRVPWSQVQRIRRCVSMRWPTYALSFSTATAFGSRVYFSLPFRAPFGYDDHGLVEMQQRLRKQSNG